MPEAPPKYPRIPYLTGSVRAAADDIILSADGADELLQRTVIVEEKLDGANVALWVDGGIPRVASRGGAGSADRAGILGPVRAWAMEHSDALRAALGDHHAVYGEWLLRRHAVPYTRLPGPFVGLDALDRLTGEFEPVVERDRILAAAGIAVPPRLFTGRLNSAADVRSLHRRSQFGDEPAEGIVVRAVRAPRAIAKLVDPRWTDVGGASWSPNSRSNLVRIDVAGSHTLG